METHKAKAETAAFASIPHLEQSLEALRDLVYEALSDAAVHDSNDLGFMAAVFLSKQLDHAVGVLRLGDHPDTALIARSMLEGRCQLLWAAQKPTERPRSWRAFAWVIDWRTMRATEAGGEPVADETKASISRQLAVYGSEFVKRAAQDSSKPLPDDRYRRDWYPCQVRQLFEATDSLLLYETLYVKFSEWHHWSPGGVGHALSRSSDGIVYNATETSKHATALACAFQCLLETAKVADAAIDLPVGERLNALVEGYLTSVTLPS